MSGGKWGGARGDPLTELQLELQEEPSLLGPAPSSGVDHDASPRTISEHGDVYAARSALRGPKVLQGIQ